MLFSVLAPDGSIIRIEGPEDATDEELQQMAMQEYDSRKAKKPAYQPPVTKTEDEYYPEPAAVRAAANVPLSEIEQQNKADRWRTQEFKRLRELNPPSVSDDRIANLAAANYQGLLASKVGEDRNRVQQYLDKGLEDDTTAEWGAQRNAAFDATLEAKTNRRYQEAPPDYKGQRVGVGYNPNTAAKRTEQDAQTLAAARDEVLLQQRDDQIRAAAQDLPLELTGLAKGFGQAKGSVEALTGLLGDVIGNADLQKWGMDAYRDTMRQTNAMSQAPGFSQVTNADEGVAFLRETLGYSAFQAAQAMLTGGAGGAAGNVIGRKVLGETVALATQNVAQTLGMVYGDAQETARQNGEPPPPLWQVAAGAIASAAVDTFADKMGLDAVTRPAFKSGVMSRLGAFAGQVGLQGGTEGIQKVPEEFGAGKDPFRPGVLPEYVDEIAAGAVGGAGPGVMAAAQTGPQQPTMSLAEQMARDRGFLYQPPAPTAPKVEDQPTTPVAPTVQRPPVEAPTVPTTVPTGEGVSNRSMSQSILAAESQLPGETDGVQNMGTTTTTGLAAEMDTIKAGQNVTASAQDGVANSDTTPPTSVWTGRNGGGYETAEQAEAQIPARQRAEPTLSWTAQQLPNGRFQLVGREPVQNTTNGNLTDATSPAMAGGPGTVDSASRPGAERLGNAPLAQAGGLAAGGTATAPALGSGALDGAADQGVAQPLPQTGDPRSRLAAELEAIKARNTATATAALPLAPQTTLRDFTTLQQEVAKQKVGVEITLSRGEMSDDHKAASALVNMFGKTYTVIEQVSGRRDDMPNGTINRMGGRNIYIDKNTDKPALVVAVHESTHGLPDHIRKPFVAAVNALITEDGRQAFLKKYGYENESAGVQSEEVAAFATELMSKREDFWNEVRQKMGNKQFTELAKVVLAKLKDIVTRSRNEFDDGFADKYITDIEQMRSLVADAYVAGMREQGLQADEDLAAPVFANKAAPSTATPEFKRWFGDWEDPKAFSSRYPADKTPVSHAVNKDRTPMVLYHATNGDFNTFETGRDSITSTTFGDVATKRHAIFTTPDVAFAEEYLKKGGGQNVMPVYMSIKSPMDLRNNGAWDYVDDLNANGFPGTRWPNLPDTQMWEMFDDETGEQFVAAAKKAGYDGAIMYEVNADDKMVEVWVAFDPAQIKSAIGNNGQYDPENADIRFSQRPADFTDPEERLTVSTAQPWAKPDKKTGYQPNSYTEKRVIDSQDVLESKTHVSAIVNALAQYNTLPAGAKGDKLLRELHAVVVDNLLWLHDHVKPEMRERAKLWYDGANRIANDWTTKFDVSLRQASGVLAVFSPQMDWFKNVSLAERALTILHDHGKERWSEGMTRWAESWLNAAKTVDKRSSRAPLVARMREVAASGQTLDAMAPEDAALFVRAFDEAYFPRSYRLVTPEGGFGDFVTKSMDSDMQEAGDEGDGAEGPLASVAWGAFSTIEKAVKVYRDGAFRTLDVELGGEHKVRNFYNNIVDPKSADGHVTIDTHAVAAALLKALSGASDEVKHNLGGLGQNAATGASGSYALFADAYRDAAAQRSILAREMQSLTWEAVRSLFPAAQKNSLAPKVSAVWDRVRKGELSSEAARSEILDMSRKAGGDQPFAWVNSGEGSFASGGAMSFDSAVAQDPAQRDVRTLAPVKPTDKMQVSISASTEGIDWIKKLYRMAQSGNELAHTQLQVLARDGLKEVLGRNARVSFAPVTGLYGGYSEPSLAVTLTFKEDQRQIVLDALKQFADNFNQEQIHVRQPTKELEGHEFGDGSYATPVFTWALSRALSRKEVQKVIDKAGLYGLTFGDDFVEAYYVGDPKDGQAIAEFGRGADRVYASLGSDGGKATYKVARLWAYGRGEGGIGWPGIDSVDTDGPAVFSNRQSDGRDGSDLRRDVGSNPQDRSAPPRYGSPVEGATSAVGVHYSKEPRTSLNGGYYGTGLKGLERERLAGAQNNDIRPRVFFYVDKGNGVRPEAGVGGAAHRVQLDNLYDAAKDPKGLIKANPGPNNWERALVQAGFDGYLYVPSDMPQGFAVLIGKRHSAVPVEQFSPAGFKAPAAPAQPYKRGLTSKELKTIDMAAVQAVAPSAKLRMGTLQVDQAELDAAREVLADQGIDLPDAAPAFANKSPELVQMAQEIADLKNTVQELLDTTAGTDGAPPKAKKPSFTAGKPLPDTPADWAEDFMVRTVVGYTTKRQLGAKKINSPADLARATSYLYRSAVERYDMIVTDAKGKPLAIVGSFKGAISQAAVYPAVLASEAVRVPGAKYLWASHNHPSGLSTLSSADRQLSRAVANVFDGSGLEYKGLMAVGDGQWTFVDAAWEEDVRGITTEADPQGPKIPVVEREQTRSAAVRDLQSITSPAAAKQFAREAYDQVGPSALLLDSQNRVLGVLPLGDSLRGPLRDGKGLQTIFRAVSEANVGAVIIGHQGELDQYVGGGRHPVSQNIAAAFALLDARPLDIIRVDTSTSMAESGEDIGRGPVFANKPTRSPLGLYSALADGVAGLNVNAASAQGWKDALKGLVNKGQVKADEVEWSGITDWLDLQQGRVTKDAVAAYLQQGGVQVEETVLGKAEEPLPFDEWIKKNHPDSYSKLMEYREANDREGFFSLKNILERNWRAGMGARTQNPTKYSQYTLPGGENYREVLLTLPAKDNHAARAEITNKMRSAAKSGDDAEYDRLRAEKAKLADAPKYKSSHWDQPNIVAHIRVNDRVDSDGKKTLFVEELQSDFQQDYRKAKEAIKKSVESDFQSIVARMKKAGVLEVVCD